MNNLEPKYNVEFVESSHYYIVDGKKCGSVTSVLGIVGGQKTEALKMWARKVSLEYVKAELNKNKGNVINEDTINTIIKAGMQRPSFELTKAANFGTKAHESIDNWISTKVIPTDSATKPVFDGFMDFIKNNHFNIISGDITLGSKIHSIGGRADGIAIDSEGNYIIIDFKTSSFTSPDYFLQVSAYAYMLNEMYGVPVPKKCYIIKFAKDIPSYEITEVDNIDQNWKAFLAAKQLKETIESISKDLN